MKPTFTGPVPWALRLARGRSSRRVGGGACADPDGRGKAARGHALEQAAPIDLRLRARRSTVSAAAGVDVSDRRSLMSPRSLAGVAAQPLAGHAFGRRRGRAVHVEDPAAEFLDGDAQAHALLAQAPISLIVVDAMALHRRAAPPSSRGGARDDAPPGSATRPGLLAVASVTVDGEEDRRVDAAGPHRLEQEARWARSSNARCRRLGDSWPIIATSGMSPVRQARWPAAAGRPRRRRRDRTSLAG